MRRYWQRGTALLTALVVLAGTIGIPMRAPVDRTDGELFPCMHHACGCASAAACWRGCCCMTAAEKLAWASEHGITPPPYVLAEAASEIAERGHQAACCRSHARGPDQASPPRNAANDWRLIQFDDARRCQGLADLWLVLAQALPPPASDTLQVDLLPADWLSPGRTEQRGSPCFAPATPPPRPAV